MFGTRFEGMTEAESRPLLEFLDRHTTRPEFTCRVSWEVDQVVMWDNRFTLHYPINDFSGERRLLLRCTALGSRRGGRMNVCKIPWGISTHCLTPPPGPRTTRSDGKANVRTRRTLLNSLPIG